MCPVSDFKWFLPAEERAGDLTALESEIETSYSESEVEYIEPDSTPVQTEMTAQQLLCPPVVAQTRPTVQITFIFIDFRVCDFAFAFKTQNAPCVSRFKRVLFSDRFQFAF